MAKDKKSFVLYCDQKGIWDKLDDAQAGRLIKHILSYVNDENPEVPDFITELAFEPIKLQLKRDLKKWEETTAKRSEAGLTGAKTRWQNIAKDGKRIKPMAKIAVNVNDNVTVINNSADKSATLEFRKDDFYKSLIPYTQKYGKDMLRAFFDYWTEASPKAKKMRWEKQAAFEINLRLATWAKRGGIEPQDRKADYSYAENMRDMRKEEWEKLFRGKLETDNDFRKHFGYEEL
jgi:hypothetical protein